MPLGHLTGLNFILREDDIDNFEELNWHDNAIHAFRIRESDVSSELEFDIDHILDWLPDEKGVCSFRLTPATLVFHSVSDLIISINYANAPAVAQ